MGDFEGERSLDQWRGGDAVLLRLRLHAYRNAEKQWPPCEPSFQMLDLHFGNVVFRVRRRTLEASAQHLCGPWPSCEVLQWGSWEGAPRGAPRGGRWCCRGAHLSRDGDGDRGPPARVRCPPSTRQDELKDGWRGRWLPRVNKIKSQAESIRVCVEYGFIFHPVGGSAPFGCRTSGELRPRKCLRIELLLLQYNFNVFKTRCKKMIKDEGKGRRQ